MIRETRDSGSMNRHQLGVHLGILNLYLRFRVTVLATSMLGV